MKIVGTLCYLDAFSGISGDMAVGALADAGADQAAIIDAIGRLNTGAVLSFEKVKRSGIAATKFHVNVEQQQHHRHLSHILRLIEGAGLPERAARNAAAIFERLAQVEAAAHGVPVEKVHFHEVGAVDSIADIVGACVAFESLGVETIVSSPLNLGSGTVNTEHGILPVPAPATAALVEGKPVYVRGPAVELTTPTGTETRFANMCCPGWNNRSPKRICLNDKGISSGVRAWGVKARMSHAAGLPRRGSMNIAWPPGRSTRWMPVRVRSKSVWCRIARPITTSKLLSGNVSAAASMT